MYNTSATGFIVSRHMFCHPYQGVAQINGRNVPILFPNVAMACFVSNVQWNFGHSNVPVHCIRQMW
jgi:hypothetical protein